MKNRGFQGRPQRRTPNAIQQKLQQAVILHQQGKLLEAKKICEAVLKRKPNNFDALHFLGLIAYHTKNLHQAEKLIGRAIAINPNVADAHNIRGIVLNDLGRPEEALASFDKAIALKPAYAAAYSNRGNVLQALRRLDEALANYEKAIGLKPDYAAAYSNRGIVLNDLGRLDEALASFDKVIALKPGYASVYCNRGLALNNLRRLDEALASYDKAIVLKPDYAEAYYNRGNALNDLGRLEEALASFDKAIALKPDYAEAYYNRGNALNGLRRLDEALASYDKAIALNPGYAEAYNNCGNALMAKGDFPRAIENYNRALEIKPDFAACYRNCSLITAFKPDNPIISKMKELLSSEYLSESDFMHLHLALSKSEHDLGNKELCINHLIQGNAIRKKYLAYDISRDDKLFAEIMRFFESGAADMQTGLVSNVSMTPIFIIGMPRSGTTLVEQIISSHSKVFGAGEVEYLEEAIIKSNWQIEKDRQQIFSAVRSDYSIKMSKVSDASIITDKVPLNFRWIGFIENALPNAKIVHLKRNPIAICWSNFKTYFPAEGMGFSFDIQDIAKYYRLYEDLMEFWHRRYPGKIYDLTYERLTENQQEETRKLFDYLELKWEDSVLEFHKNERAVNTASSIQVRQEMYKGSSLEWKKYEQWLQPMPKHPASTADGVAFGL